MAMVPFPHFIYTPNVRNTAADPTAVSLHLVILLFQCSFSSYPYMINLESVGPPPSSFSFYTTTAQLPPLALYPNSSCLSSHVTRCHIHTDSSPESSSHCRLFIKRKRASLTLRRLVR